MSQTVLTQSGCFREEKKLVSTSASTVTSDRASVSSAASTDRRTPSTHTRPARPPGAPRACLWPPSLDGVGTSGHRVSKIKK